MKTAKIVLHFSTTKDKNYLLESWETLPTIFITSAEKHVGREDIMKNIEQLIQTSPYKIGK